MQTTEIRFVVWFLFLYNGVDAKYRECGEFDQNSIVAHKIEEDSVALPFQGKLERLFDAFDRNDDDLMEEAYKSLEDVEITDAEDYSVELIKYVVSAIFERIFPKVNSFYYSFSDL